MQHNYYSTKESRLYRGTGDILIANLNPIGKIISGHRGIGLVDQVTMEITNDNIEYYESQGDKRNLYSTDIISTTVSGVITLRDLRPENIALLLGGTLTSEKGATAVTETVILYPGLNTDLKGIVKGNYSIKLGSTTLEEGESYMMNDSTIYVFDKEEVLENGYTEADYQAVFADASAEKNGVVVTVTYDSRDSNLVQAYVKPYIDVSAIFRGYNTFNGATEHNKVNFHKMRITPSALPLKSPEDYASVDLNYQLLSNPFVNATDVQSQYFTVRSSQV